MKQLVQQHYINGQWLESAGAEFSSVNPATDTVLWRGNAATAVEVNAAVQAARDAFADWRELSLNERQEFVARFVEQLKQHKQMLAEAIHEETGKPLWESVTEVGTMVAKAAVSKQAYQQRTGSSSGSGGDARTNPATSASVNTRANSATSTNTNANTRTNPATSASTNTSTNSATSASTNATSPHSCLVHRPIGVFAVLGPYNFPGHLPNGHIIPALLAGNTVVFKPSELTPRVGELMMQCWVEAGLPRGVVNLVQGGGQVGKLLVAADLDGLLFTGSSRTGHAIHKAFGGQPEKMLALEMGGNNPLVVEQVADLEAAVYTIIQSAFISSGQRCTCARRLVLLRNAANEKLLQRLAEVTKTIKVGSSDDCFMGPLISNHAADQVMKFTAALLAAGAKPLLAPRRPDSSRPFVHPGIVEGQFGGQSEPNHYQGVHSNKSESNRYQGARSNQSEPNR